MSDLFISDLHLSPERPAITRAFFHFLDTLGRRADSLYILGDLVEAWVGDDDPDQHTLAIVRAIRAVTESGTTVYFLHGNRDFLVGKGFARESGAKLLRDYHVIERSGRRILLCHGDSLCTDDRSYQRFRRVVRNPIFLWGLARLSLARRQGIAHGWRAKSQQANSNKASNIMDVNSNAVAAAMAKYKASLLIHGHTHRPAVHDYPFGKRVVLGDWGEQGWYGELIDGEVDLHSFSIS